MLDGYRHVEVASVSDAMEKLTGQRMFMSHRMRPIFTSKFAGFALTVRLKKEENHDPDALQGMLAAIDRGGPNSVYVMVVEDGIDIAGMGGLMGTAMAARNFSRARDRRRSARYSLSAKDRLSGFRAGNCAFNLGQSLSFRGTNIPVICDGVPVTAGDVVVADWDGVVVVPRAKAEEVLTLAQDMDFKEHSMYAYIEKLKSIEEAVKKFGRL